MLLVEELTGVVEGRRGRGRNLDLAAGQRNILAAGGGLSSGRRCRVGHTVPWISSIGELLCRRLGAEDMAAASSSSLRISLVNLF